jgi:hypothetical protein
MLIVMKGTSLGRIAAAASMGLIALGLGACGSGHMRVGEERGYVVVPALGGLGVVNAYDRLHALGLKLELTRQVGISSLLQPSVRHLIPQAGSRVLAGSTVRVEPWGGPIGSSVVLKSNPHYVVPRFLGEPAAVATNWADAHAMFWSIPQLPTEVAGMQPHLLDAYRIVGQRPGEGQPIRQGVRIRDGFRPTPLTLIVVQR